MHALNSFRETLQSLWVYDCRSFFFRPEPPREYVVGGDNSSPSLTKQQYEADFSFEGFDHLKVVNLGCMSKHVEVDTLLKPLKSVTSLDLSNSFVTDRTFFIQWTDTLRSLVLYNVEMSEEMIASVLKLVRLRKLDIARENKRSTNFRISSAMLTVMVQRLVDLVYLDISGHVMLDDCTVPPVEGNTEQASSEPCKSDIVPLRGLKEPLLFLGLFDTSLCNVTNIPALKVTGSKNEEQVLNAIEAYKQYRPELAHRGINHLFDIARIQHCEQLLRAIRLTVSAMNIHRFEKSIQVTGSAALFYLTNADFRRRQSPPLRREVVRAVLNGMEQYQEVTVQRNCCLTLCNFGIPEELEFEYERVNRLLLHILELERMDESIQRIAVHLCNALVCQVDNHHKETVGKMGFVEIMLKLVKKKLRYRTCDQVMEFAWSALWNITDETPDNCQMFLSTDGMRLFLECLQKFPDRQELHRNMLGLLGNVAEVKTLRRQLLTPEFISVFSNLLDSKADGIEVSYNACGVLSHIMFDGPEAWCMMDPPRDAVINKMWEAIRSWDLSSRRNINYRSFEPILRLLPQDVSFVSQHWATWALFNLVSVYPNKYCPLLVKEGGMPCLAKVLELEGSHPDTKEMARKVMKQCEKFTVEPMEKNLNSGQRA